MDWKLFGALKSQQSPSSFKISSKNDVGIIQNNCKLRLKREPDFAEIWN